LVGLRINQPDAALLNQAHRNAHFFWVHGAVNADDFDPVGFHVELCSGKRSDLMINSLSTGAPLGIASA
jgi:hypothetical protein